MHIHHILVMGQVDPQFSELPDPHVPDLATLNGMLDLFMLCIFTELGEFLDPTAYKQQHRDGHALEHDRLLEIHTQGAARHLLQFWDSHFMFLLPGGCLVDGPTIFHWLFAHQVKVLITYNNLSEKQNIHSEELECKATVFAFLVHKYFPGLDWAEDLEGSSSEKFNWPMIGYTVSISGRGMRYKVNQKSSEFTSCCIYPNNEMIFH